jgi:hypothetical protein
MSSTLLCSLATEWSNALASQQIRGRKVGIIGWPNYIPLEKNFLPDTVFLCCGLQIFSSGRFAREKLRYPQVSAWRKELRYNQLFALARDAGTPQYVVNDAARIYRWFTQGLVDGLKDAKALLHELRGQYALFSVLNGEPRRAKVLLRVWHTSERQMPVLRRR